MFTVSKIFHVPLDRFELHSQKVGCTFATESLFVSPICNVATLTNTKMAVTHTMDTYAEVILVVVVAERHSKHIYKGSLTLQDLFLKIH